MTTITFKRSAALLAVMAGLLAAASPATAAGPGGVAGAALNDAMTSARFSLTVDGIEIASFSELVSASTPGGSHTLTFKRGQTNSMDMLAWHQTVVEGQRTAARKSATLVMHNASGEPVARYHLENAWPSKVEIGAVKADSNDILIETVTFTATDVRRING